MLGVGQGPRGQDRDLGGRHEGYSGQQKNYAGQTRNWDRSLISVLHTFEDIRLFSNGNPEDSDLEQ